MLFFGSFEVLRTINLFSKFISWVVENYVTFVSKHKKVMYAKELNELL